MEFIKIVLNDPWTLIPIFFMTVYIYVFMKFVSQTIPHKCKFKISTPFAKYARCWCGSGICLREAERKGIDVYLKS